jgi:hypothetical protein
MNTSQILSEVKAEITRLQQVVGLLEGTHKAVSPQSQPTRKGTRMMSAVARRRIAAAQRARWAEGQSSEEKLA